MMTAAASCCKLRAAFHDCNSTWSGEHSCRRMRLQRSLCSPQHLRISAGPQKCTAGRRAREVVGLEKNADAFAEERRSCYVRAFSDRDGAGVEVEESETAQEWEELRRRANSGADASSSDSSLPVPSGRFRSRAGREGVSSSHQQHVKLYGHSQRAQTSPPVPALYGVHLQPRTRKEFLKETQLNVEGSNAVNARAAFDVLKGGFVSDAEVGPEREDVVSPSGRGTITNGASSTRRNGSEGFRRDAPAGMPDMLSAPIENSGVEVAASELGLESGRVYEMHRSTSSRIRKERRRGRRHLQSAIGRTRVERGSLGVAPNAAQTSVQGASSGISSEGDSLTKPSVLSGSHGAEPPLLTELLPQGQESEACSTGGTEYDWQASTEGAGSFREAGGSQLAKQGEGVYVAERGKSESAGETKEQLDARSCGDLESEVELANSEEQGSGSTTERGRRRAPNLQSPADVVLSRGADYASKSISEREEQRVVGQRVVEQVLAAFQKVPPGERASSVLDRWQGQLRAIDCNQIVKALGRVGRWRRSLEVLQWMQAVGGDCAPSAITYVSVLSALGRVQEVGEAERLFEEMPSQGLKRSVIVFNTMMNVYVRSKRTSDALALFPRMAHSNVLPDFFSYATAINACATTAAWLPRGISLFEQMRREGIHPDAVVYNTLMKACLRGGQPAEAVRIFRQMQDDGVKASLVGFNTLMDAHAEAGAWQEASEVLDEMRTAGFVADMVSYNTLVKACCRAGKLREGLRVLAQMRGAGLRPNAGTFTLLISGCANAGLSEQAAALFAQLKKEGIRPDAIAIAAAIDASESLSRVDGYLEEMADLGLARTSLCYTALVRAYSRLGEVPRIAGALLEARRQSSKLEVGLYNAAMEAYSQAGRVGDVVRVFGQLERDPCTVDEVSFTILMDAQGKAGLLSSVLETLRRMQDQGLVPGPVQLNVAVDAFAKAGDVERAEALFEDSVHWGVEPGVPAYNSLLAAFARAERVGDCVKVYRWMRKTGVRPTVETFSVLIDAFGRSERITEAEAVFRRLEKDGLRPDVVAFTAMITAYGRAGMVDNAIECFQQMRRTGIAGDVIAYTALMSALQRQGWDDDLLTVYDQMVAEGVEADSVAVSHRVGALCRLQRGDEAEAAVAALLRQGDADARSVTPLVELFAEDGRVERARGWLTRMRAGGIVPDVGAYSAVITALGRLRQFDEAAAVFEEMQRMGVAARLTRPAADELWAIANQARH